MAKFDPVFVAVIGHDDGWCVSHSLIPFVP